MLVNEVMTPDPITVGAGVTVKKALCLLDREEVTSLPVVDDHGLVVGVVSEIDLIRDLVAPDQRLHVLPVGQRPAPPRFVEDVMSRQVKGVRPETDLAAVVAIVTSTGFKSLPVLDDSGRAVGVVSRRDVVRVLATDDAELADAAEHLLREVGREGWSVDVHDGVAEVEGPDSAPARSLAAAVVGSVPGVVQVRFGSA